MKKFGHILFAIYQAEHSSTKLVIHAPVISRIRMAFAKNNRLRDQISFFRSFKNASKAFIANLYLLQAF